MQDCYYCTDCTHVMRRQGTQADTGGPTSTNKSLVVSKRNVDPGLAQLILG